MKRKKLLKANAIDSDILRFENEVEELEQSKSINPVRISGSLIIDPADWERFLDDQIYQRKQKIEALKREFKAL